MFGNILKMIFLRHSFALTFILYFEIQKVLHHSIPRPNCHFHLLAIILRFFIVHHRMFVFVQIQTWVLSSGSGRQNLHKTTNTTFGIYSKSSFALSSTWGGRRERFRPKRMTDEDLEDGWGSKPDSLSHDVESEVRSLQFPVHLHWNLEMFHIKRYEHWWLNSVAKHQHSIAISSERLHRIANCHYFKLLKNFTRTIWYWKNAKNDCQHIWMSIDLRKKILLAVAAV